MSTSVANDQGTGTLIADGLSSPSGTLPLAGQLALTPTTVAAKGTVQGNASALTSSLVYVTATASTEGILLTSGLGNLQIVAIPGTVGSKVYPPLGAQIGTASTNAAIAQAAGKTSVYAEITSKLWIVLKGA